MNNKTLNIKVIIGSTRQGRFSEKPAQWIFEEVKKLEGVEVELLDLRDYEMPFFDSPISPSMAKGQYSNETVKKWAEKINDGDAFIIVTPEYNHSTSGVLKNAIDWIGPEWNKKPVAFMSYGSVGGARAVEQLRLIAVELQMAPIREAIHINGEQYFPVIMGGGDPQKLLDGYKDKAKNMISQLLWWAKALKTAREN